MRCGDIEERGEDQGKRIRKCVCLCTMFRCTIWECARRHGTLDFEHLKKMGVVLKRAHYFITCSGKMMYRTPVEEGYITRQLIGMDERQNWQIAHRDGGKYRQMSLFADFGIHT